MTIYKTRNQLFVSRDSEAASVQELTASEPFGEVCSKNPYGRTPIDTRRHAMQRACLLHFAG
jgi:hypothetical protein